MRRHYPNVVDSIARDNCYCVRRLGQRSCRTHTTTDSTIVPDSGVWYQPEVTTTWQWQLQGTVNTQYDVDLYDIDLFDSPTTLIAALQSAGRRVICYFSGGSFEDFRSDAGQFRQEELGSTFGDFPNERWLDIRSTT